MSHHYRLALMVAWKKNDGKRSVYGNLDKFKYFYGRKGVSLVNDSLCMYSVIGGEQ